MINVLYVTYASDNFDGATYSLMDLIKSVRGSVNPIVLLRTYGCVYEYFTKEGIECIVCDFQEDLLHIPKTARQYVKSVLSYLPNVLRYNKRNKKCVEYVVKELRGRDIKIVHTNNTVMSVGYKIAKKLNVKHVWHLRGFIDLGLGWKPLRGWCLYKKEISLSDAVIGITPTVLEHYISPTKNNTFSIFDAVRSKSDICESFPKQKFFLFCASFLTERKGCDFAIESFAKSELAQKGYRLRIIGECSDSYRTHLNQLLSDFSISDSVDFIGRVDNVREHMKYATAFLMCSEYEGLGRVSVEAMFYGCLVLGRNSGGTKDFIFDDETGFLFDDVDGCVMAMKKAVVCEHQEIIHKAQEFACLHFSIENYGEKILAVYNKVLA